MLPPIRLKLRDTGLHDDISGAGQRIWTTAGQGYEKIWFIELGPVVSLLKEVKWEIKNLREKIALKEDEGWEGSKRRAFLDKKIDTLLSFSDPVSEFNSTTINEVR